VPAAVDALLFGASAAVGVGIYFGEQQLVGEVPFVCAWLTFSLVALAAFARATLVDGFLHRHAEGFGYR
jgi:hypothetical protein